ncbi:sensor histidine kinase [Rudanella paleaurantiibacter]|nr:sensor histidine kinase [Rudanella paleaurantiibacter]
MNRMISDRWLRWGGISLVTLFALLTEPLVREPLTRTHLILLVTKVVAITLHWYLNRAIIIHFRLRSTFPFGKPSLRAVTLLACTLGTAVLAWVINLWRHIVTTGTPAGYDGKAVALQVHIDKIILTASPFGFDLFRSFLIAAFFLILYELYFYNRDSSVYKTQLEQLERERERLQMVNLQSQLEVLKQQVNPHFLFNALNSLSALISEDPEKAEVFVDKLSSVYRYVLRSGTEQNLTTLAAELQFIDGYYHLLQTRYGSGLTLSVAIPESAKNLQLPPLTLQLLVENAVKHNVVSVKRPLHIQIQTDQLGWLIVQNNLQHKATRALSNGVGLSNIVAKYQMLNLPQPVVSASDSTFEIRLPLSPSAN